jgi:hypothetical protein
MKRTRPQTRHVAQTSAGLDCVLPSDILRYEICAHLGREGTQVAICALTRLARTCHAFYDKIDWRASVVRLAGPFTRRLTPTSLAPFAPFLETLVYYLPSEEQGEQLNNWVWARCTRLRELTFVQTAESAKFPYSVAVLPRSLEVLGFFELPEMLFFFAGRVSENELQALLPKLHHFVFHTDRKFLAMYFGDLICGIEVHADSTASLGLLTDQGHVVVVRPTKPIVIVETFCD